MDKLLAEAGDITFKVRHFLRPPVAIFFSGPTTARARWTSPNHFHPHATPLPILLPPTLPSSALPQRAPAASGASTDVVGFLRRLHNSMVTAVAEDSSSLAALQAEGWLADAHALEWEDTQRELMAALGMGVGVGVGAGASSSSSSSSSGALGGGLGGGGPRPGTAAGLPVAQAPGVPQVSAAAIDPYAKVLSQAVAGLAQSPSGNPLHPFWTLAHRQYARVRPEGQTNDRYSRLYIAAITAARELAQPGGEPPRTSRLWSQWAATGAAASSSSSSGGDAGAATRSQLTAPAVAGASDDFAQGAVVSLRDALVFGCPEAKLSRAWAFASLEYLAFVHLDMVGAEAGSGPALDAVRQLVKDLDRTKYAAGVEVSRKQHPWPPASGSLAGEPVFAHLYFLLRRGEYEAAASTAAAYASAVAGGGGGGYHQAAAAAAVGGQTTVAGNVATALAAYARYFRALQDERNAPFVAGSPSGLADDVLAALTKDHVAFSATRNCASHFQEAMRGAGRPDADPYCLEVLCLVAGAGGNPDPVRLPGGEPHPIAARVLSLFPRPDWAWHRLWFAASSHLANAFLVAAGGGVGVGAASGMMGGGAYDLGRLGRDALALASDPKASGTPYEYAELLLICGQPEYAVAHLAARGRGDGGGAAGAGGAGGSSSSNSSGDGDGANLHDAVHLALGLAWHGLFRSFPFHLAAQAAAHASRGQPVTLDGTRTSRPLSDLATPGLGGFLYDVAPALRPAKGGAGAGAGAGAAAGAPPSAHPVFVVDLPLLVATYVARVLGGAPAHATSYFALLPHKAARIHLTALVLAQDPDALPTPIGGSEEATEEFKAVVKAAGDLARANGAPDKAVHLYTRLSGMGDVDGHNPLRLALGLAAEELAPLASAEFDAELRGGASAGAAVDPAVAARRRNLIDIIAKRMEKLKQLAAGAMDAELLGAGDDDAVTAAAGVLKRVVDMCDFFQAVVAQRWTEAENLLDVKNLVPKAGSVADVARSWVSWGESGGGGEHGEDTRDGSPRRKRAHPHYLLPLPFPPAVRVLRPPAAVHPGRLPVAAAGGRHCLPPPVGRDEEEDRGRGRRAAEEDDRPARRAHAGDAAGDRRVRLCEHCDAGGGDEGVRGKGQKRGEKDLAMLDLPLLFSVVQFTAPYPNR